MTPSRSVNSYRGFTGVRCLRLYFTDFIFLSACAVYCLLWCFALV